MSFGWSLAGPALHHLALGESQHQQPLSLHALSRALILAVIAMGTGAADTLGALVLSDVLLDHCSSNETDLYTQQIPREGGLFSSRNSV